MLKRLFAMIVMLIAFSSLYSCASNSAYETLDTSNRAYERAIRWGEFSQAKSFHKNAPELSDLERRRLKLYRVTGYNTISASSPNNKNSYVTVEIKYYKNDRPVVKTLNVKQHWKRDEGSDVWYLDSAFPAFK